MYSCQSFSFSSGSVSCSAAWRSRRATTSSSLPSGISRALAPLPALSSGFFEAFSDFRSPEVSRRLEASPRRCVPLGLSSGAGTSVPALPEVSALLSAPCPSAAALPAAAARRVSRSCATRCCSVRSSASKEPSESSSRLSSPARRSSEVCPGPSGPEVCALPVPPAAEAAPAPAASGFAASDGAALPAGDAGGAGDVGADAAGGFRLLDVPDGRLVAGFLFPPAEADATGRARRGAAGNAAAAVGLAAAAVHPDDVTHVRCGNLLRESRPGQQLLDGLGARGRGARLEPRKRRIDELVVTPHGDGAVAMAGEPAADTVHEAFLRLRPLDLGLGENDHRFTLDYVRMQLARFVDTRLHAAGQSDDRGKGEDALRPD